MSDFRLAF